MSTITRPDTARASTGRPARIAVLTLAVTASCGGALYVQDRHWITAVTWLCYAILVAAAAVVAGGGPSNDTAELAAWTVCAGTIAAGLIRALFIGPAVFAGGVLAVAMVAGCVAVGVYGTAAARRLYDEARDGR